MINELLSFLTDNSPVSGLFGYISVRAAAAAITAFLIALLLGPRVIEWLRRSDVGERVDLTDSKTLARLHSDRYIPLPCCPLRGSCHGPIRFH